MVERGTQDSRISTHEASGQEPQENLNGSDHLDIDEESTVSWRENDATETGLLDSDEDGLDDIDEDGLDDADQERGADDPDPERGAAYPQCQEALGSFLDGKNLAYQQEKNADGTKVEQISMAYRGTANEPGLSDITSEMREKLGYAQGRFEVVSPEHVDTILESVTEYIYRNDSMQSRYNRAEADLSQAGKGATAFKEEMGTMHQDLREKVADELLNGSSSAQDAFQQYQNRLNQGAKDAAEAKASDFYRILGTTPAATAEELLRARRDTAKQYHSDHHPYPEYETYMAGTNIAYEALSDRHASNGNGSTANETSTSYETTGDDSDLATQEKNSTTAMAEYDGPNSDLTNQEKNSTTAVAEYDGPNSDLATQEKNSTTAVAEYDGEKPKYDFGNNDPMLLDWSPEKDANWHEENEGKKISWLEHLMLAMAMMIAHAAEEASGRTFSAASTDLYVSNYLSRPRGESSQTQHLNAIDKLGNLAENPTMKFAVSDQDEAQNVQDLTGRSADFLSQYPMHDSKGVDHRKEQEPTYSRVTGFDPEEGKFTYEECNYSPIEGLEWDNDDQTMEDTMVRALSNDDEEAMLNRQHLSDMLKERVNWIQGTDAYIDFNDPAKYGQAEELLNQYDQNQMNLGLQRETIEPALLWNAENSMGGMAAYIDKSIEEKRRMTEQQIRILADTIRHCDYMINATGQQEPARRQRN